MPWWYEEKRRVCDLQEALVFLEVWCDVTRCAVLVCCECQPQCQHSNAAMTEQSVLPDTRSGDKELHWRCFSHWL